MVVPLLGGDVEVVGLDLDLGVNGAKGLFGCLDFGKADLRGREEEAVHVGELDLVIVVEDEFSDTAAGEHFCSNGANTANSDYEDALEFDILGRGTDTA